MGRERKISSILSGEMGAVKHLFSLLMSEFRNVLCKFLQFFNKLDGNKKMFDSSLV